MSFSNVGQLSFPNPTSAIFSNGALSNLAQATKIPPVPYLGRADFTDGKYKELLEQLETFAKAMRQQNSKFIYTVDGAILDNGAIEKLNNIASIIDGNPASLPQSSRSIRLKNVDLSRVTVSLANFNVLSRKR